MKRHASLTDRAVTAPAHVPQLDSALDAQGLTQAKRLRDIVQARATGNELGPLEYEQRGSLDTDGHSPDSEAVAIRERLVRHGLDAIAAVLLPESLSALRQVLAGTHPAGASFSGSVNGAAKLVFDALRMTGSHVIDRDRTRGADALTIAELEAEVERTRATLARKQDAMRVVTTVDAPQKADDGAALSISTAPPRQSASNRAAKRERTNARADDPAGPPPRPVK